MAQGVKLRLSAKSAILWHLHVVLDSVAEGPSQREQFARKTVRELGCPSADFEAAVEETCTRLPADLQQADMREVLTVLERVIPIEWVEDRTVMDGQLEASCQQVLQRILAERVQGTLPSAVTTQMIAELEHVVGVSFDAAQFPRLRQAIQDKLVYEMWRSVDDASRERLAEGIMYTVKSEARLKFGSE